MSSSDPHPLTVRARVMLHRMIPGGTDPVLGVYVTRTTDAWDIWDPRQCRCQGHTPAYRGLSLDQAAAQVVALRPGHRPAAPAMVETAA